MIVLVSNQRVVLLRHGETAWSRSGQHTGRTDLPLTTEGETAARAAGPLLAALGLRDPLVLVSPRQRARHTAQLAGLTISRTWDDLAEWDYGDYEGATTAQIREGFGSHPPVPHWTVWTHPCPNGETAADVGSRADTVLAVTAGNLPDRDVVLVGHGHFSRVLITRWIELPVLEGRRFAMSAGAFTVLGFEHDARTALAHNITPQKPL
jgi:probable phosphoglycerate mutase